MTPGAIWFWPKIGMGETAKGCLSLFRPQSSSGWMELLQGRDEISVVVICICGEIGLMQRSLCIVAFRGAREIREKDTSFIFSSY